MATVSKWTPFGVALDITATAGTVTRTSATRFTVKINVSWETYYDGAQTNYGMTAASGGITHTISAFNGTKRSSGSGSFTGTYTISGNGSATKTITVTFKNFNTDNGDSATKNVTFNVTVPAWTSYKVTYNANGGSSAPGSQTKWKDQTLVLSTTKPTRTGYSFLGWSTSSTATTATYSAGGNYTSNSAATLYAVWKANTYTVKFNANGGTGAPGNQTKTYGQTLKLSSTVPTRTNYKFKGWGTSASATTATYQAGGSYTNNSAVTLYAVWELAYIKPRISNVSATRCDSTGNALDDGTNALISFNWECDKTVTEIIIKWKLSTDTSWTSKTVSASGTSGTVSQVIGSDLLNPDSSYDIHITVSDSIDSAYTTDSISSAFFATDYMPDGRGAAFGKSAELEDVLDIAFETLFRGGIRHPVLENGTDLDTVILPNTYIGNNANSANYMNCPLTSGSFTLEVTGAGPTGQLRQRLIRCYKTDATVYERFYYTSAWGDWIQHNSGDSGWQFPTLTSKFALYGSSADNDVKYRKIGKIVEVRGIVTPTADLAGNNDIVDMFTVNSGYRPSNPLYIICQGSGNSTWLLRVTTGGVVGFSRYRNGDTSSTAAAGTWLPFQITYFVD